jgi:hypothetical protein
MAAFPTKESRSLFVFKRNICNYFETTLEEMYRLKEIGMGQRTGLSSRMAIVPALAACLFATAASAAGGSISFAGAIVPSSYGVVVASAAADGGGLAARGTELRFVTSPSDPKSAEVRVERPDRGPIPIRCGAGMQAASGAGCRLGDQGGRLTMMPPAGQPAVAVVITTYD